MVTARWLLSLAVCSIVGCSFASEPCRSVKGLAPLLGPGKILLLGEIHGTRESPRFVLDVACHAAHAGLPVLVGLEIVGSEQQRVNAFLDSPGAEKDKAALLAGNSWVREYQDGRNSRAMLELIDGLRRLRSKERPLRIVFFDEPGRQRDMNMAHNLSAAIEAFPKAMTIVLSGNQHSRTSRGRPRDPSYEPMGYLLKQRVPAERVTALNAAHGDGSAWICAPDCGAVTLAGRHGDRSWSVEVDDETRPAGHHGWYHVGAITASVPARFSAEQVASHAVAADPVREDATHGDERVVHSPGAERKIQGDWQAQDVSSNFKMWKIRFDGQHFHAKGGEDDWYDGRVSMRTDSDPAQIDFAIEDCVCGYKGMTSRGIYYWDGDSIVLSAPTPGKPRPSRFERSSGQVMRLVRLSPK